MNEIQQLLLSDSPLLISRSGYLQLMVSAFPALKNEVSLVGKVAQPSQFFGFDMNTYSDQTKEQLEKIKKSMQQVSSVK